VKAMTKTMCRKYSTELKALLPKINQILHNSKYSNLAQGRQSLSFLSGTNILAPMALKETVEFIKENLGRRIGTTVSAYNMAIMELMEKETLTYTTKTKKPRKARMSHKTFMEWLTTLNTMLKSAERGRKDRRSIATATMLIRGFVKTTEDISKEILTILPNSGLPVGGVEKLAKLASILNVNQSETTGELSGDEEKWNECLDPDGMRVVLDTVLEEIGVTENERIICCLSLALFKGKRAKLGKGIAMRNKQGFTKYSTVADSGLYPQLLPLISGDTILCRLGMFMGMFHFTSTLMAMAVTESIGI
jgi:hypothetical protein